MIDVDIDHVAGQIRAELEPARVPGPGALAQEAVEEIVLVVVVGYERSGALVVRLFVIGIDVTEMAPPVFVRDLPLAEEGTVAFDNALEQRLEIPVRIIPGRCEMLKRAGPLEVTRRQGHDRGTLDPGEGILGRSRLCRLEEKIDRVRFLLTALELVALVVPRREKPYSEAFRVSFDGVREVLPELIDRSRQATRGRLDAGHGVRARSFFSSRIGAQLVPAEG